MKRSLLLLACVLSCGSLASAEAAFQFAAPGLNAPDDPHVAGLRLSVLHGRNQSVEGVDFGALSMSETSEMSGIAFIAGVHKLNGNMSGGAAFSVVNHHSGRDRGLNHAFVNVLQDPDAAVNIAYLNVSRGSTLVDLGGINVSKRASAQIGFLNVTEEIEVFQFGFVNLAQNGFLPVFPVFNFPVPARSTSSN